MIDFHSMNPCRDTETSLAAAGAIIVEWNVHDPSGQQGAAGTWDTHIMYVCLVAYESSNIITD